MAALLIVNPFASGVDEQRLAAVAAALSSPEVVRTSGPGHATTLAREALGRVEAIHVFGGDGTFNEVLNGVDATTPLGLVPGGGTSVLPRALGLPRDPVRAAERIAVGRPRRIGLGRAGERRFGFNAGIGLDAELVRRVDALGRRHDGKRPGDGAFAWTAIRLLAERRGRLESALELDGLGRAAFALVANCSPYTYVGRLGLPIAPEASFDNGLDVVAPARVRARSLPRLARYAVTGRGQATAADVLYAHDAARVVVRCDAPMPLQLDGEDVGDVTEMVFTSEPDAVTVLV
ncbi:MAG TPA: diacylglycerol kinase family protein [Gaiellaceae bacterium]|nr:diacylglycerol kinase family protein [Gaiellaceae bacterium]